MRQHALCWCALTLIFAGEGCSQDAPQPSDPTPQSESKSSAKAPDRPPQTPSDEVSDPESDHKHSSRVVQQLVVDFKYISIPLKQDAPRTAFREGPCLTIRGFVYAPSHSGPDKNGNTQTSSSSSDETVFELVGPPGFTRFPPGRSPEFAPGGIDEPIGPGVGVSRHLPGEILDFTLQRQEFESKPNHAALARATWTAVPIDTANELLSYSKQWASDVLSEESTHSVLTMPLPRLDRANWGSEASHPKLKSEEGVVADGALKLFRFVDTNVRPGFWYRYRVQLSVSVSDLSKSEMCEWSDPSPVVAARKSASTR